MDDEPFMPGENHRFLSENANLSDRLILQLAGHSSLEAVLSLTTSSLVRHLGAHGPFVFKTAAGDVCMTWAEVHQVEHDLMQRRVALITNGIPCPKSAVFFDDETGGEMSVGHLFGRLSRPRNKHLDDFD